MIEPIRWLEVRAGLQIGCEVMVLKPLKGMHANPYPASLVGHKGVLTRISDLEHVPFAVAFPEDVIRKVFPTSTLKLFVVWFYRDELQLVEDEWV